MAHIKPRRATPGPHSAGLKPDAKPLWHVEQPARDDPKHVAAVLKQGGYPRAVIATKRGRQSTVWLAVRGLWRFVVPA